MSELAVWGMCFGAGALLLLTAQPHGAPTATFAERLASLRPDVNREDEAPRARVFRTRMVEEALRPLLEALGRAASALAARTGLPTTKLQSRLRAAGDPGGLALFLGQKIASALLGLALPPLAASLGLAPLTAVWVWAAAALAGFCLPDVILSARVKTRRLALSEGLAQAAELLSLAVSSGLGLEQALDEAASAGEGAFFAELRAALRDARVEGAGAGRAIELLAERTDLPDAASLASAVRMAEEGAPLVQTLRAQARSIRERRRLALLEAGERSQVHMRLPVGLLILPAFFVLVLYPATVTLLGAAGQP